MTHPPLGPPRGARLAALAGVCLMALASAPASLQAAPRRNETEMRAREAFAAGRYQDALDIYVKLYAEQLHPNYLRNIGRCYQNLEQPERAISSFREYLRKASNLSASERAEIDGYIAEMQALERRQAQAASHLPAPPTAAAPVDGPPAHAPALVTVAPPPERPSEPAPVYKRWWFWTALGAVVAGATAGVLIARGKTDLCPAQRDCGP